jgi:hypothetical protein
VLPIAPSKYGTLAFPNGIAANLTPPEFEVASLEFISS